MFLKVFWKEPFFGFNGKYTKDNTIVVDDNPLKYVLNPSKNVILLKT
jgi:hypothetical protein